MDDDEYPVSDTDDQSTTAVFGEAARQTGRRRNKSSGALGYAKDNLSANRIMQYYNGEANEHQSDSDEGSNNNNIAQPILPHLWGGQSLCSSTANLSLHKSARPAPDNVARGGGGGSPDSDSEEEQMEVDEFAEEVVVVVEANLSLDTASPLTASAAVERIGDMKPAVMPLSGKPPTAASQQPPQPVMQQSAASTPPGDKSTAPLPPTSSAFTPPGSSVPAAFTPPGSSVPTAAAEPRSEGASQGGAPGQQRFGGGPSQFRPAAAASPPVHPAEEVGLAMNYVTTVKERFRANPEIYRKFLEILRTFQMGQREIKEVLDEVLSLFVDHADLLRGFSDYLPGNLSHAQARLESAAALAEERAGKATGPMLTSPPGAASPANFASSPISVPPAARADSEQKQMPSVPSNKGGIVETQNTSAIGVEELNLSYEEQETCDDVNKVLFEEAKESAEAADKSPVICDVCQDLTVFNRVADMLSSDMCCCEKCNVDAILHLSQTTEGSVASSHYSERGRSVTFKSLCAEQYKMIHRSSGINFQPYRGIKAINRVNLYTSEYGSGQAARLALQCLLLSRSSSINSDGTVSWRCEVETLVMPLKQFKRELQKDVGLLQRMSNDDAQKHLGKEDIGGGGDNVVVTALRTVAKHIERIPAQKMRKFDLHLVILNKIAEELVSIANNIDDEDAEFPWVVNCSKIYPFPAGEDWRRKNERIKQKLGNGTLHRRVSGICVGIESVVAFFACEATSQGHRGQCGPPKGITMVKNGDCPRRVMAEFSLAALFEGLLCDPVCGDEDFCKFIVKKYDKAPTQLSTREQMEALLAFLRLLKAIPEWYIPYCLRVFDGDLDARADEVRKMKEVYEDRIGGAENLKRLRKERQQMKEMEVHEEALQKEHIRRCKVDGKHLLDLICDKDKYFNNGMATGSLAVFKEEITSELKKIDGLVDLSADDFPTLRSANDPVWKNEDKTCQRVHLLSKLSREVITVLYPSKINGVDLERQPGDCTHACCSRNQLRMDGSSFQGKHVNDTLKTSDPSALGFRGIEKYIEEMEDAGILPACALHHDGAEERRDITLDDSKHHLLSPPQDDLRRDEGNDLLGILRDNRVRRLQYILFIMDCYGRGWMKDNRTDSEIGDYNTLRVMMLAYFDTVADDVVIPSANQWNDCNTGNYIRSSLRYIVQNHCGVCPGANKAGTKEVEKKLPESWEESDYACCKENYDYRKYAPVERQRIEGDHTIGQSAADDAKVVSRCMNIFEMLDEICHAPYLCYFCHKRRTANQRKENSYHLPDRNYTT